MTSVAYREDASRRGGELPVHFLKLSHQGQLGFTLAPGRRGRDAKNRLWTRDLDEDLERLRTFFNVDHLFCLLPSKELSQLRIDNLVASAKLQGIRVRSSPLPASPDAIQLSDVRTLCQELKLHLTQQENVVLVSGDGLGRAPFVTACYLIESGCTGPAAAIEKIRRLRNPNCLLGAFEDRVDAYYTMASEAPTPRAAPQPKEPISLQTAGAQKVAVTYGLDRPQTPSTAPHHYAPTGWTPFESTCVGMFLGAALGDALGAPLTVITDNERLETLYGSEGPLEPQITQSPDGGPPVAVLSSHSQMAEYAMETAIESRQKRLELSEMIERMAARLGAWVSCPRGGHRNPDPTCLESCKRIAGGASWTQVGSNSESGCSGLARAAAMGLAFSDDLKRAEQWAAAQSRITHRAQSSVAAAAALAVGVARFSRGEPLAHVTSEMVAAACRQDPRSASRLAKALHEADSGVPTRSALRHYAGRSALEALLSAIFVVRQNADDLIGGLRHAVMTIGDSEAVGATVGALLGARLGSGALPPAWLEILERRATLEGLALALAASR